VICFCDACNVHAAHRKCKSQRAPKCRRKLCAIKARELNDHLYSFVTPLNSTMHLNLSTLLLDCIMINNIRMERYCEWLLAVPPLFDFLDKWTVSN
jgi:hypothetical protein